MTVQLPPRVVAASVRLLVRPLLSAPLPVPVQRGVLRAATVAARPAPGVLRDAGLLGARPAEIHTPPDGDGPGSGAAEAAGSTSTATRAVLYLHGGAFTLGSPATHRALCSYLAAAAGMRVYALHYRLAPEDPYPAALDDALSAAADLRARGVRELVVAGDSAGGWLALATALALRDRGEPAAAVGLISPWVDLTVPAGVEPGWAADALLSRPWLLRSAAAYLRRVAPDDPRVDLTTADLSGLPPVTLQVGTAEALLTDARSLRDRLVAAGVAVGYEELPDLWHVSQAQAGQLEAATAAVGRLGVALAS